jgi:chemotaxis protein MotB
MEEHNEKNTEELERQKLKEDARISYLSERALLEDGMEMPSLHWSVPWSDLMMTMFILFTVLFVYASAKRDFLEAFRGHVAHEQTRETNDVGRRQGPVSVYDLPAPGQLPSIGPQQLFEMAKASIDETGIKDVQIEMAGDRVLISMHGPALFDRLEAELKPEAMMFLDAISDIIKKARYLVNVHGHTDNFPVSTANFSTNWELSTQRAVNVVRYLVEERGAPPAIFTASGHSMFKPAAPNLSDEGKDRNRRVEIEFKRPEIPETAYRSTIAPEAPRS